MSDSPVLPRLAAVVDVSLSYFVFHSAERAEREKAWAVRIYLNCRCPWKNASLPAPLCVRACVHIYVGVDTHGRRLSCDWRATEQQTPAGKRGTAIAAWKSNWTIVGTHSLLISLFIFVNFFQPRVPFSIWYNS